MAKPTPAKSKPVAVKVTGPSSSSADSIQRKISQRQSKELVVAFSGPIGSGIKTVIKQFRTRITKHGYRFEHIKLSEKIQSLYEDELKPKNSELPPELQNLDFKSLDNFDRYKSLQDIGNYLRSNYEEDVLVQLAIEDIMYKRSLDADKEYKSKVSANEIDPTKIDFPTFAVQYYEPKKTVYVIDQLKNPAEVSLLRDVYGDLFYLVGVLCGKNEREQNLKKLHLKPQEVMQLMHRDRKQEDDWGQHLEKTLKHSDYFISNTKSNTQFLNDRLDRLIDLIHDEGIVTPTKDEHGMYLAQSASLNSACLSKQVGASIANSDGEIIATGSNDVPKFGGGLYSRDDEEDLRCFNLDGGKCFNDDFKKRYIREELSKILDEHKVSDSEKILDKIYSDTRIKDLIEFSRSIHAEMDALISLARLGKTSSLGCTLYTTTYPCHNCARHIIAAGIKKVIYIEPYEKSLAVDLHGDAISSEDDAERKVVFIHFEGVAPRKYFDFFLANRERKDARGIMIKSGDYKLKSKVHQYLDSYRTLETKVAEHLQRAGIRASS